jgi:hypothetical protein
VGGVLVTEGNWKAGGAFAVHRDVPVAYLAQPSRDDLRPYLTHPFINYVVASPAEAGLVAVERAGLAAAGFVEVRREGAWRVFHRVALGPNTGPL